MNIPFSGSRIRSLLRNEFANDVLTLIKGTAVAHIIGMAAAVILARLYVPEQFGVFSIYTVVLSVVAVFACLSYESAIVLPKDEDEASVIPILCAIISIIVALVSVGFIIWGSQRLADVVKSNEITPILWWVPLNIFAIGVYQALYYWNTRIRDFKRLSLSRIWQSGIAAIMQVGGGLLGCGVSALVFGQIVGQIMGAYVLSPSFVKNTLLKHKYDQAKKYIDILNRYRKFPLYSTWGTLMNVMSFQSVPLIIAPLFGPGVTGLYFLAYRIISAPIALIAGSLGNVFLQRSSSKFSKEGDLSRLVAIAVGRSFSAWLFPFVLLGIFAPALFISIFGAEWEKAGIYVRILTPLFFSQLIVSPVSVVLIVLQKQQIVTIIQALLLFGAFFSLGITGYLSHNPIITLSIYSGCQTTIYLIYLLTILWYSSTSLSDIVSEMFWFSKVPKDVI